MTPIDSIPKEAPLTGAQLIDQTRDSLDRLFDAEIDAYNAGDRAGYVRAERAKIPLLRQMADVLDSLSDAELAEFGWS